MKFSAGDRVRFLGGNGKNRHVTAGDMGTVVRMRKSGTGAVVKFDTGVLSRVRFKFLEAVGA